MKIPIWGGPMDGATFDAGDPPLRALVLPLSLPPAPLSARFDHPTGALVSDLCTVAYELRQRGDGRMFYVWRC